MQGGLDIHIRCIGGLLKLGDNSLDLVGVVEQGVNLGAALKVGHSAAILAELQVALSQELQIFGNVGVSIGLAVDFQS